MRSAIIATYPRSGKTYFTYCFNLNFLKEIPYTHLQTKNDLAIDLYDEVITIVRNPYDAISSFVAMEIHYFDSVKNFYIDDRENFIKEYILNRVNEYNAFHLKMMDKATIIISFEDLTSNTQDVINFIAKKLNIELKNNIVKDLVVNNEKLKFLKTSKNSEVYKDVANIINSLNLDNSLDIYNNLLNKR
jgi:hypothetical protein